MRRDGHCPGKTTEDVLEFPLRHAEPFMVGLNCARWARKILRPYLTDLSAVANTRVSVHPNAGLPNEFGGYDDTPESMARVLSATSPGRAW